MSISSDMLLKLCLDTLLATMPLILFAVNKQGIFTMVIGRGLMRAGIMPSDLVGKSAFSFSNIHPEIADNVRDVLDGRTFTAIVEARGCVFETRYRPIRAENGEVAGGFGVALDITDQTRLSDQVLRLRSYLAQPMLHANDTPSTNTSSPDASSLACEEISLKSREIEILQRVARDKTNSQIAAKRDLNSVQTGVLGITLDVTEQQLSTLQQVRQPDAGSDTARQVAALVAALEQVQQTAHDATIGVQTSLQTRQNDKNLVEVLTRREREVLQYLVSGRSNSEIGLALGISERTVEGHVGHIQTKLGVQSRVEVAVWAVRVGLT